jgi:hypothetical protein
LSLTEALSGLESQFPLQFFLLEDSIIIQHKEADSFSNQVLSEVLLSQYLAKGVSLNKDRSVTIKPKGFNIIPGLSEPNVLASVKSLPGISSTDEFVTNLNIRGGTNDQNLILWDGIKMCQSGHFFGMISAFDPYIIHKINVIKNGTSTKLGDRVSGRIEMMLYQEPNDKVDGSAGFNLIAGSALVKTPLSKKITLQISARRSNTDLIETATYSQYFDRVFQDTEVTNSDNVADRSVINNQKFFFYDISGKLLFDLSKKDKLSASFISINNEFNFLEPAENTLLNQALERGLKQQNNAGSLRYKRQWSPRYNT